MVERTTVRLPEDLLRRAKKRAAAEGRTLTSLVEEGLRLVTSDRPTKRLRVPIPISSASGGLAPGVDLTHVSKVEEADDLAWRDKAAAQSR